MNTLNQPKFPFLYSIVLLLVLACAPKVGAQAEAASAPTESYSAEVANAWFDLQLELVKQTPGFSPPVASRAFGYTGVALYETIVPGMPGYQTLAGQLSELRDLPQPEPELEYDWQIAANSALATITRLLFPTAPEVAQAQIDALDQQFADNYQAVTDTEVFRRSQAYGEQISRGVFDWSMTDGGHEGYARSFPEDYVPLGGDGMWVPTPRTEGDPQPALHPYWGDNRTFIPTDDACMPPAPPTYSEAVASEFYVEANEVYQTVENLTQEQTDIALFWADEAGKTATPPGHTLSILTQILQQENASLAFAGEAYAKLGIAVADSFIGCWKAKYLYNLLRPVTYIQQFMDENWMPLINTPPFPEYPSGHSVQAGAAQAAFTDLFGEAYPFTDHTHDDFGLAGRSFETFEALATEAALSRLYGGIHYRSAIELGLEQGRCIGQKVNNLTFQIIV